MSSPTALAQRQRDAWEALRVAALGMAYAAQGVGAYPVDESIDKLKRAARRFVAAEAALVEALGKESSR